MEKDLHYGLAMGSTVSVHSPLLFSCSLLLDMIQTYIDYPAIIEEIRILGLGTDGSTTSWAETVQDTRCAEPVGLLMCQSLQGPRVDL